MATVKDIIAKVKRYMDRTGHDKDASINMELTGGVDSFVLAFSLLSLGYKVDIHIVHLARYPSQHVEKEFARRNAMALRKIFGNNAKVYAREADGDQPGTEGAVYHGQLISNIERHAKYKFSALGVKDEESLGATLGAIDAYSDAIQFSIVGSGQYPKIYTPMMYVNNIMIAKAFSEVDCLRRIFWSCLHRYRVNMEKTGNLAEPCGECDKCREYESNYHGYGFKPHASYGYHGRFKLKPIDLTGLLKEI